MTSDDATTFASHFLQNRECGCESLARRGASSAYAHRSLTPFGSASSRLRLAPLGRTGGRVQQEGWARPKCDDIPDSLSKNCNCRLVWMIIRYTLVFILEINATILCRFFLSEN